MKKNYIAINTHLILWLFMFFVFIGLSVGAAIENQVGLCISFAVFALVPVFVFVISPLYFVFNNRCTEIIYVLGQREQIRWGEIRNISQYGSWIGGGGLPRFVVAYQRGERRPFFVCGEIVKTRRTEKLIRKYYKIEIL